MGKLTDEQKIEIVNKYTNNTSLSCSQLARDYGISSNCIPPLLRRRGVIIRNNQSKVMRKYFFNESYFDIIDSEDKAYFLGLLYADGCNLRTGFSICLQYTDKIILEKLKDYLNYTGPLQFYPKRPCFNKYVQKPQWKLCITGKILSEQLTRLGCVPKKSLILTFPTDTQVPNHLLHHFVRGYWDGDGHISKYEVSVVSTIMFCNSLKEKLETLIGIKSSIYEKQRKTTTRTMSIRGTKKEKNIFLNWLYKDATIYLQRKYERYLELSDSICFAPQQSE